MSDVLKAMLEGLNSTIVAILAAFAALLRFPDWSSMASVREWCTKLVTAGDTVTPLIPGTFDDKLVDGLNRITASEEAFAVLYSILVDMINQDADGTALRGDTRAAALADKVGLPITTILAIAAFLYKMYQQWKDRQPAPTESVVVDVIDLATGEGL